MFIDWFADDIQSATQGALSYRNFDGATAVYNPLPMDEAIGAIIAMV